MISSSLLTSGSGILTSSGRVVGSLVPSCRCTTSLTTRFRGLGAGSASGRGAGDSEGSSSANLCSILFASSGLAKTAGCNNRPKRMRVVLHYILTVVKRCGAAAEGTTNSGSHETSAISDSGVELGRCTKLSGSSSSLLKLPRIVVQVAVIVASLATARGSLFGPRGVCDNESM